MNARHHTIALIVAALALIGCGQDDATMTPADEATGPGATGIAQGGAQDFGLFRQILEDGGVPGPDTIDDVGFFAEHKLDYPAPSCGDSLCAHALVGAMGNMISGADCTLLQIGLNSPLDADALGRPAMHLVISVDVSGSMKGDPISFLRAGLIEMTNALQPQDHISLVKYAGAATVVLEHVPATETDTLVTAFESLTAGGSTNLYDGLFTAYRLADAHLQHIDSEPRHLPV